VPFSFAFLNQQFYSLFHLYLIVLDPETIKRSIHRILESVYEKDHTTISLKEDPYLEMSPKKRKAYLESLEKKMFAAAGNLEFEEAARLRDELKRLEEKELEWGGVE